MTDLETTVLTIEMPAAWIPWVESLSRWTGLEPSTLGRRALVELACQAGYRLPPGIDPDDLERNS